MNSPTTQKIENYARQELKLLLDQCSPEQKMLFKRMYSHENLSLSVDDVIDKMPFNKVMWGVKQADASVYKTT